MYSVALASGNAIALEVASSEKFLANIDYTCRHLYPVPKLLILNYPHNPSTVTVEPEFYVEVVKLAKRYGFMVISDFAYADVAFDGYRPPSFLAAPGASEVGVEFTTMSKGYNMAGWRVGFCCVKMLILHRTAPLPGNDLVSLLGSFQIDRLSLPDRFFSSSRPIVGHSRSHPFSLAKR